MVKKDLMMMTEEVRQGGREGRRGEGGREGIGGGRKGGKGRGVR